ncbi:ATP-dependent RNA helicase dbp2 [Branchiostoma belcheri]|nr:ATP-dependent RNA helicase dbp2 [Branchiostoma belcheri]
MAASGGNRNAPLLLFRILHKIAKELDKKDELEEVKFLCNGIISLSTLEKIDSHLKLFQELTKKGHITEDDFSFVEDLLQRIGRQDLLNLLRTELDGTSLHTNALTTGLKGLDPLARAKHTAASITTSALLGKPVSTAPRSFSKTTSPKSADCPNCSTAATDIIPPTCGRPNKSSTKYV